MCGAPSKWCSVSWSMKHYVGWGGLTYVHVIYCSSAKVTTQRRTGTDSGGGVRLTHSTSTPYFAKVVVNFAKADLHPRLK